MSFESEWLDPPREFSLMPFWFWNDELHADELLRQIAEFEANGVYGFVIHPRVGLPRDCGWMSDKLLGFYRVAIEEAARRDMRVLLYDEGMYPSGSSCGQVVARHPDLACRGLALHDAADTLPADAIIVERFTDSDGHAKLIVDRRVDAYIRGLHYVGDGPAEDEPPAGDILNPRTADTVIELVYQRFHEEFGQYFGSVILGIFTDEPNPLGKCREQSVFPYTTGILPHLQRLTGRDFAPDLRQLWQQGDVADGFRDAYRHACRLRLEETWYAPLSAWCDQHNVALCGHPDAGDEIGVQKYFQIPGQDLVWRWVAPNHPSAFEGAESTQAKCSASAMVHAGRRRNSNEFAGAYGPETTFEEIRWLAHWCLVRGVNLLIPHAFYYSIRGPRCDERPPQVGPHTPQWNDFGPNGFKAFADECRRLCWLNTDSTPVVSVAILTHDDCCPWRAAKILLQHQIDFHYLDPATLVEQATVDATGIRIGDMHYALLVIDGPPPEDDAVRSAIDSLAAAGRVVCRSDRSHGRLTTATDAADLVSAITTVIAPAIRADAGVEHLRVRIVRKSEHTVAIFCNEDLQTETSARFQIEENLLTTRLSERTTFHSADIHLDANELSCTVL